MLYAICPCSQGRARNVLNRAAMCSRQVNNAGRKVDWVLVLGDGSGVPLDRACLSWIRRGQSLPRSLHMNSGVCFRNWQEEDGAAEGT